MAEEIHRHSNLAESSTNSSALFQQKIEYNFEVEIFLLAKLFSKLHGSFIFVYMNNKVLLAGTLSM